MSVRDKHAAFWIVAVYSITRNVNFVHANSHALISLVFNTDIHVNVIFV